MSRTRFSQFVWGLLAYNVVVILGGAFVRATVSGDGCGDHWPLCKGEVMPTFAEMKTLIEFGHRLSTGILLPLVLLMLVWAFRAFPKGHPVRMASFMTLVFTLVEGGIGAALVLYQYVAHDDSVNRAIVMPMHLIATFFLLMFLALAGWWSSGGQRLDLRCQKGMALSMGIGLFAMLMLGMSGAITALGDTLFPAASLEEGLAQDFSPESHFLLRLRIFHPLIAISAGLYLLLVGGLAIQLRPSPQVRRMAGFMGALFMIEMAAGLINLRLLAPVWMQLVHLLLADLLWISVVLLSAAALAEGVPQVERLADREWEREESRDRSSILDSPSSIPEGERVTWKDYVVLTKPRVISLLLFTTITAMIIAAGVEQMKGPSLLLFLGVAVGFYMAAGASNAINMVLERDLDIRMARTSKRPTVTRKIPPGSALMFAMALLVGSFLILTLTANILSAMLALAGLVFYVIVYTMVLKRRTWANIVIGGAAGAFPPLVGWAAVTGDLSLLAWCLFGIIFLWTPVHFWALALFIKEDYARAGVPMLPVVRGERATAIQIGWYAALTVAITVFPLWLVGKGGEPAFGRFYLAVVVLLNLELIRQAIRLYRRPDHPHAKSLFKYSMVYLALLFLAMAVDRAYWV
ncbi:MAG: heme o synthase [Armatimonadetes bacterium]|nr:heme o synthase [Armatimonadota bacterium]